MFEQNKYKIPLDNFISNNPNFTRTDLENQLSRLGIYTGATPNRSINRDVLKYLRKNVESFDEKSTEEIRKTKDEPISDDEFARDDFIDRDDGIWYKKLLKTGTTTSNKWGKTSLKIEIYTFEKNDKCRFDSLLDAVISKVPEVQYIDDGGYSSSRDSSGEFSPFQFESAYLVVKTSETSTFYDGAVTLTDTNETPC
tara:strand:- start:95 stop:685 length:591 start_codon:yes stop_codon:yes gene_type:complete